MNLATAIKRTIKGAALSASLISAGLMSVNSFAGDPEKEELKFGFIKLTDMAPLAIAAEKGFFEDEGLFVELEAQANWKVCVERNEKKYPT